MDNVKIKTGKATAKIASLLRWQHKDVSGACGKSSGKAALGRVLEQDGPLPGGDSKAPPAKRPFLRRRGYQIVPLERERHPRPKPQRIPFRMKSH